jgi:CRP-like cAMP-binding protein
MSQLAARSAAEALLSPPSGRSEVAHDWLGALEEVPLFADLPKRHLRRVAKLARVRRFAPGSALVRAGDAGRSFFVLLDGHAKVVRVGGRPRRLGFAKLLRAEPTLAQALLRTLAARLRAAEHSAYA